PGDRDNFAATVNYGDGTGDQSLELNIDRTFQLGHTYSAAGVYHVSIVVTDADGASGTSGFDVTVTGAVRGVPGFQANTLGPADDDSSGQIPLGWTADFLGHPFDHLYVNNNGNVTFDSPKSAFTPYDLSTASQAIIAPFFADVYTFSQGSDVVR